MKIRLRAVTPGIGIIVLLAQALAAQAAEVKVLAGGAISGVLDELAPQFERATGHKLVVQYGLAPQVKGRIEAGEVVRCCAAWKIDPVTGWKADPVAG